MPRVHSQKAAKDYPAHDIKKGDTYYWWKFRHGGKVLSKTFPRQSQLTQSDKLSRAYATAENLSDAIGEAEDTEAIVDALNDAATSAREIGEEYGESADNIESAFPNGSPTADDCREKADSMDSWADELESAASEVEALDDDEEDKMEEAKRIAEDANNCPL